MRLLHALLLGWFMSMGAALPAWASNAPPTIIVNPIIQMDDIGPYWFAPGITTPIYRLEVMLLQTAPNPGVGMQLCESSGGLFDLYAGIKFPDSQVYGWESMPLGQRVKLVKGLRRIAPAFSLSSQLTTYSTFSGHPTDSVQLSENDPKGLYIFFAILTCAETEPGKAGQFLSMGSTLFLYGTLEPLLGPGVPVPPYH